MGQNFAQLKFPRQVDPQPLSSPDLLHIEFQSLRIRVNNLVQLLNFYFINDGLIIAIDVGLAFLNVILKRCDLIAFCYVLLL